MDEAGLQMLKPQATSKLGQSLWTGCMRSLILLVLLWAGSWLHAQEPSFEASVDRNPVGQGEAFTLSFTLRSSGMGSGKNLKLPDLSKFQMLSGPNQSTNMQFINGAMSSSQSFSYVIQARDLGKHTIGSASIEVAGKSLTSPVIHLEVVKGNPKRAEARPEPSQQIGDNVFLKAVVDRTRVFQGEQINLSFKIYTRLNVAEYLMKKSPSLTGFWSEERDNPPQQAPATETVNGKAYRVGILKRMALFPTQAGNLEIGSMEVQSTVQVQSRDPFAGFFGGSMFGQTVKHLLVSEPLKITVDPLPAGAPAGFKGAVGRFSLNRSLDKRTTRTHEPISFKITLSGTGNLKLLEAPVLDLPKDFEAFTPKVTEQIQRGQERISGSRTFEYLLFPRNPGERTIPAFQLAYFDPAKKQYQTLTSPSVDVKVEPGAALGSERSPTLVSRTDVQLLNQDIRFIKVGRAHLERSGDELHRRPWFVLLLLLPPLALGGAWFLVRQHQADLEDQVGTRDRKALKVATQRLKTAERMMVSGSSGFHAELVRALYQYLCDKLQIQRADLSIQKAMDVLAQRGVDPSSCQALGGLLESCEMARFASMDLDSASMRQHFEQARSLIQVLEKSIRRRP